MKIHEKYIKRCIQLAKNGLGTTYPNPMVGSVIVYNDTIIGEGWHQKAGEPHAEVNAINSVKDKSLLKDAIIYVSLEPCSHYGKTPPCANLIVESGIKKVVIGIIDSNSEVCGRGILHLQKNGCDVIIGVLEQECYHLNKRFFTYHQKQRPFIILKWAETKDKFIDKKREKGGSNSPNWISNKYSQQLVHKMRAEEQAILVGTNTALNDNPSLTVRDWCGENPIRILIDKNLKVPKDCNLLDDSVKTVVLTNKLPEKSLFKNTYFEKINFSENVPQQIIKILYKYKIQSVLIEGGAYTLKAFIDKGLWDEAYVFEGNTNFKDGLKAPKFKKVPSEIRKISDDTLYIYKNS